MPGREPFKLQPRDPVLYFVQRLRDEAHRFAVGSHRARRRRDIREAGLQEIPGIGPTRKRALLHHFGTLKAIERAALADLAQVPGHQRRDGAQDLRFLPRSARHDARMHSDRRHRHAARRRRSVISSMRWLTALSRLAAR